MWFNGNVLLTKANVAVLVTNNDDGLEARALTGARLTLHGRDLHDLILELVLEEVVNDLRLLDRQGVQVDLLEVLDLAVLHEATELGHGGPGALVATTASTAATTATTTVTVSTAVPTASTTTAKASPTTSLGALVGHLLDM